MRVYVCIHTYVCVLHLEQQAVNLDLEPQFLAPLSFKLLDVWLRVSVVFVLVWSAN